MSTIEQKMLKFIFNIEIIVLEIFINTHTMEKGKQLEKTDRLIIQQVTKISPILHLPPNLYIGIFKFDHSHKLNQRQQT